MIKNKTIVITGSEGLIGKDITKYFKKKNYEIIGIDVVGGKNTIKCDITNEKVLKKKLEKKLKKIQPDILINAASKIPKINKFKFSSYNSQKWIKGLEVDLLGSFYVTKICCKYFEKVNSGMIINLSSIYGVSGPDQSIYGKAEKYHGYKSLEYSVAKAGVIGFTKALSSYYKDTNIKVLCLILGGVFEKKLKKNFIKRYLSKTIENKMLSTKEICNYIEFCINNKNTISGSSIAIDSGANAMF